MNEDRLVDIEIKLARSEDLLETLNRVIYEQQRKIDRLEALYAALAQRLPDQADNSGAGQSEHERPPHY